LISTAEIAESAEQFLQEEENLLGDLRDEFC